MSGVFRELCVALSDEAMALAKGIVEAAVHEHLLPEPPLWRTSQTTMLENSLNASLGRYLCDRFGWKRVRAWRMAEDHRLVIAATLWCKHQHHMSIDESAIEDTHRDRIIDLIDKTWSESRKRFTCYCVPREGTSQV